MFSWLTDAKENNEMKFLVDILEVYLNLPVTLETLKKNNTPKIIKSLSKSEDESKFFFFFNTLYIYLVDVDSNVEMFH